VILDRALVGLTRFLVGAQGRWGTTRPQPVQRIYFANHTSHLDTMAIWSALPTDLRAITRPVAALDYWGKGGIRGLIATRGLHAVFIDREHGHAEGHDPLQPLCAALDAGASLIIFPEGTRGNGPVPAPFKAGLYHLAQRHPQVELVATYLDTLHRSLPKGCPLPLPLTCTVRFGETLHLGPEEPKDAFLARAHAAVVALADPMLGSTP
jgi:1-acyl-sn-glycerol-3-phosphate acyltransferase